MSLPGPEIFRGCVAKTGCAHVQETLNLRQFSQVTKDESPAELSGATLGEIAQGVLGLDGDLVRISTSALGVMTVGLMDPTICSRLDEIFPHAPAAAGMGMAAPARRGASPKRAAPKHAAEPRHIDLPRTIRKSMRTALTTPLFVTELVDKIIESNELPAVTLKHRFDVANQIAKTIDGIEFVFVLEGPDSNKVKYIPR